MAGAERAFREQSTIFRPNPEPFVSLALIEAARGSKKAAIENLRAAVVRGFTDLWRVERSEAWTQLRGNAECKKLVDALPMLGKAEREWARWGMFYTLHAPDDLETVLSRAESARARIDRMAPALGKRHTRLWKRLIDRVTASHLEAYVVQKQDAPDLGPTIDHLLTLYAGGPLLRWERLPEDPASRLGDIATIALERFPESSTRPTALVGVALASNVDRDKRGRLTPAAAAKIRNSLGEVLERYPDAPVLATAAVGLIRTEIDTAGYESAEAHYRRFVADHGGDAELRARVRDELGVLALRLGGLPAFEAVTLEGDTLGAEALSGKVAVLDFWATWCRPCVDGLPTLQRIRERHGEAVVLVGVNLDSADDIGVEDLRQWVASQGIPGSQIHDGMSWESELVKTFGVREIPFNVVVGPDGAVLAVNEHGKKLEKAVTAALAGSAR